MRTDAPGLPEGSGLATAVVIGVDRAGIRIGDQALAATFVGMSQIGAGRRRDTEQRKEQIVMIFLAGGTGMEWMPATIEAMRR
jgi:hypothetical protein